jgi:hypothetical protein
VGFVSRYSFIRMGWPQPNMYLWLSSSFCAVSVSRVRMIEEWRLELMVSRLHIHLCSSFSLCKGDLGRLRNLNSG